MDLLKSGFYSVLPWITMAISSNLAGYLADTLIQRGTSVTLVRKVMQTVRACRCPAGPGSLSCRSAPGALD